MQINLGFFVSSCTLLFKHLFYNRNKFPWRFSVAFFISYILFNKNIWLIWETTVFFLYVLNFSRKNRLVHKTRNKMCYREGCDVKKNASMLLKETGRWVVGRREQNGRDATKRRRRFDGRSRPIPFLLAAVSVCDIQAFTENRFAKKGADRKNKETDKKAVTSGETWSAACRKHNFQHSKNRR